ncbi:MAG: tyrosine-type recombinase/integrase [Clostridium sp.]
MAKVYPIKDRSRIALIKKILLKENRERDWIMIAIGINTGLRISDILQLRVKHVKNKNRISGLKSQKTKKPINSIINNQLKEELKPYLKGKKSDEYLIRTNRHEDGELINEPISCTQAYRIMKYIEERAGVKDNLGTHSLRKTFGYNLYQNSDISIVQGALQHDTQLDTIRYIGVEDEEIDKGIENIKYY